MARDAPAPPSGGRERGDDAVNAVVETAGPFVHPALFYRDEREYLAGVVPFVRKALAAGEPVAVAVPTENLRLLKAEIGTGEAVRFLDMREAGRNPGRIIPGVLRAFADAQPPGTRVRIVGEPIWAGRTATEYPACVQHEALINAAFQGRPVTILCPYDTRRLDPQAVADAYATHPVVVDAAPGARRRADGTTSRPCTPATTHRCHRPRTCRPTPSSPTCSARSGTSPPTRPSGSDSGGPGSRTWRWPSPS